MEINAGDNFSVFPRAETRKVLGAIAPKRSGKKWEGEEARKREEAKGAKILNYINRIPVGHCRVTPLGRGLVKRTAIGLARPPNSLGLPPRVRVSVPSSFARRTNPLSEAAIKHGLSFAKCSYV